MSIKKIVFIVNPLSIKKIKGNLEEMISRTFHPNLWQVAIHYSKDREDLSRLSKEAVSHNCSIVVAVGGDGTVQTVGKELIGTDSALAIVPTGSGNGLARHFHISTSPDIALKQIMNGVCASIDTMAVNSSISLNVAGVGFDGSIAHRFHESVIRGLSTYLWMIGKEYLLYSPQHYRLSIDGHKLTVEAFLISICNGSQYGNGARISPFAKADDGKLNVTVIHPFPYWKAASIGYRLFKGSLENSPYIRTFLCKTIDIEGHHLMGHVDGEPLPLCESLSVKVLPASLRLISPSHMGPIIRPQLDTPHNQTQAE